MLNYDIQRTRENHNATNKYINVKSEKVSSNFLQVQLYCRIMKCIFSAYN
jgi:hypothetical protein